MRRADDPYFRLILQRQPGHYVGGSVLVAGRLELPCVFRGFRGHLHDAFPGVDGDSGHRLYRSRFGDDHYGGVCVKPEKLRGA
ncbi:hypothetical protein [uncultured Paenibacillus sp.]|uniref:hypothetical protein n=1 Tax=uncultured Paenibacillus sp. TaxID=227322 RepID=UPI0035A66A10